MKASGTIQSGSSITIDGTASSERIASSGSLDLHTATGRALRLEDHGISPNLIGGYSGNSVTAGVTGGTVGGGGADLSTNRVTDGYGTIGGGRDNQAGDNSGSTVNAAYATVGGGYGNEAGGYAATVGGGVYNGASGFEATVPGGSSNQAGGTYSFAAGQRAKVRDAATVGDAHGDEGTFVWADSANADFTSTGPNQFLIRASGGVGIGTAAPANQLSVSGDADFTGNVGIGTANPAWNLDIDGDRAVTRLKTNNHASGSVLRLQNVMPSPNLIGAINFEDAAGTPGQIRYTATDEMDSRTNDVVRMRIDSAGNVGIGTTNPAWNLDIDGSRSVARLTTRSHTWGSAVELKNTMASPDTLGAINFTNDAAGTPGQIAYRGTDEMAFRVNYAERMHIDSAGNLGVGTGTPGGRLHVSAPAGDASVILPTSSISSVETLNEPGIASQNTQFGIAINVTSIMVDVETVSITAPATGIIVVVGKCYVVLSGTTGPNFVTVQIDETAGGSYIRPWYVGVGASGFSPSATSYHPVYVTRVYSVIAGTHTYRLEGMRMPGATGLASVYEPVLTATYYPTAYGAVATSARDGARDSLALTQDAGAPEAPYADERSTNEPFLDVGPPDGLVIRHAELEEEVGELREGLAALEALVAEMRDEKEATIR